MNHSSHLRIAVVAVAGVAVLGLLGFSVGSFAPFAVILLVCPLMMYFMMRGMGHGNGSGHDDTLGHAHHQSPPPPPARQPR
ncbi:MAG: DUF2933 domain-containing protein [Acidimicrobiales bacterium]